MSSTFTNLGLAALLSTTAFAGLVPRQAPANPTTCLSIEAMVEGEAGEFVVIVPTPAQNYTTGLQATVVDSTLFTLTDIINGAGTLFAVNAPGDPAKSVPVLPIDQASAPISWFNVADAAAGSAVATQFRCEADVETNYLRCAGIEQFNVCSGSIYGTQGLEVPTGCELVNLMVVEAVCPLIIPGPSTSSMPMNSTMSSTSMMSTATPSFVNSTATSASSTMMPTGTVTPLCPNCSIHYWQLEPPRLRQLSIRIPWLGPGRQHPHHDRRVLHRFLHQLPLRWNQRSELLPRC